MGCANLLSRPNSNHRLETAVYKTLGPRPPPKNLRNHFSLFFVVRKSRFPTTRLRGFGRFSLYILRRRNVYEPCYQRDARNFLSIVC